MNIKDFLIEYDYFIKVNKLIDGAISIEFPEYYFNESTKKECIILDFEEDGVSIYLDNLEDDPIGTIEIPKYAHQTFFLAFLYSEISQRDLAWQMVVMYDEKGEELCEDNYYYMNGYPETDDELNMFRLFTDLITKEQDGSEEAKKLGILDGYEIISTFLENQ